MSMFDTKPGSEPSALSELADMVKADPELAKEPAPEAAQPEPQPAAENVSRETQGSDAGQSQDETQPETPAEPSRPKMVPAAALAEERAKNRDTERKLAELEGRLQALQGMVGPQQPQQQPQQPPDADPPPDRETDPLAYMAWQDRRMQRLEGHMQAQAVRERVGRDYATDVQRFAATTPDFAHAYNHLLKSRADELAALGHQPQAIRQQIEAEEFNIAIAALRAGRSPAEQIYNLAKHRGYTAAAPKPVAPAQPAPVDPVIAEAKAKAAVSLAEGGRTPKAELSFEDIAKLSGAAFDSAMDGLERRKSGLFRH